MHKYIIGTLMAFYVVFLGSVAFANPNDGFPQEPVQQGPYWAEKPIQCGPTEEVMDRIVGDGLMPLMAMVGQARVGNDTRTMDYGFWYEPKSQFWLMAEFFNEDTMCIVGVGQGVDFDVYETTTEY